MTDLAKRVGFGSFKKLFGLYKKKLKSLEKPDIIEEGVSEFEEQLFELNTGEWHADEMGIYKYGYNGAPLYACTHPIMPVQTLIGVDTGTIKIKLAFRKGFSRNKRYWNEVVVDAKDISSATKIVDKLSSVGVSVTSGDRANALVDYLRDMRDLNQDVIPEVKSVSRMGWNEEGFSPYVSDIVFDSASTFKPMYEAIAQVGSFEKWKEEAIADRAYSTTAKIVLAASFASVLVEPLGSLPFFVHLWGMDSGTGKTVAQMLGASVWANPTAGGPFFPTFRGTTVGFEMMAGFLHSLPLFMDELQLTKDSHGRINFSVYDLASGSGKLRSNKSLGLNYTPTWSNCFITSGETPIVNINDGAGALNRVIEIECRAETKAIKDGHKTASILKSNYGHAGKMFVEHLMEEGNIDKAIGMYDDFFRKCTANSTTDKQAMAAAVILVADKIATELFFQDGNDLTVEEIGAFLKSREAVSLSERGYDIMCDWVFTNASKFKGVSEAGECYGLVEDGVAYIVRSVWNRVCAENAIDPQALLSHLKTKHLIITNAKGYTKTRYMGNGFSPNCVWMKLLTDTTHSADDVEIL